MTPYMVVHSRGTTIVVYLYVLVVESSSLLGFLLPDWNVRFLRTEDIFPINLRA